MMAKFKKRKFDQYSNVQKFEYFIFHQENDNKQILSGVNFITPQHSFTQKFWLLQVLHTGDFIFCDKFKCHAFSDINTNDINTPLQQFKK